jgi:hypothetical protein
MIQKLSKKMFKNILILFLSFTAIVGCGEDTVEDLSLTIKVNKNHIELSNITVCVDSIESKEMEMWTIDGEYTGTYRFFCKYDSNKRPVEEMAYLDLSYEGNHDETIPVTKKYLEWNDTQQELIVTTWTQHNPGNPDTETCQDGYCITNRQMIRFQ